MVPYVEPKFLLQITGTINIKDTSLKKNCGIGNIQEIRNEDLNFDMAILTVFEG